MFPSYFATQDQFIPNDYIQRQHNQQNQTPQSEDQYIEQFLGEGVLDSNNSEHAIDKSTEDNSVKIDEDTNGLSPKTTLRQKSKFHNYQKHLIITLRKTVKLQKSQRPNSSKVVKQLWRSFCASKIYNKSLLRILFGEQMIQQQLNLNLFLKEGFRMIVEKYASDQIIEAQHTLRNIVLSHFQQNSIDNLLKSRKLPDQTKKLFKKYIIEFIGQLKEGNVMKRLPKSRKRQILIPL